MITDVTDVRRAQAESFAKDKLESFVPGLVGVSHVIQDILPLLKISVSKQAVLEVDLGKDLSRGVGRRRTNSPNRAEPCHKRLRRHRRPRSSGVTQIRP